MPSQIVLGFEFLATCVAVVSHRISVVLVVQMYL